MSRFVPPGDCPVCGDDVPHGAKACPGCGATGDAGWNDETIYDGVHLPEEDFDYDDFVDRSLGKIPKSPRKERLWLGVAVVLVLILLGSWLGGWVHW